jgi:phosphatidylglycerophosphate synthase
VTAERFWTPANTISLTRIPLALAFVVWDAPAVRLTVVLLAALSDAVDGWVARRSGRPSRWGALIDPVADRTFAIIAIAALAWDGVLTEWMVALLLSRDFMTAVGLFISRRVPSTRTLTFAARPLGKVVTVFQFTALVVGVALPHAITPAVVAAGVVSLLSVADYTWFLVSAYRRRRRGG